MTAETLLRFASTLEGERLETGVRRAGFTVAVSDAGIQITPESSGKPRLVQGSSIRRFLEEYARSGSKRAGDYQEVSFDASYLLAIIARYEMKR